MLERTITVCLTIDYSLPDNPEHLAQGGGFLFICFGDCEPWQYVLMALSIVLTISCCCCYACIKASDK